MYFNMQYKLVFQYMSKAFLLASVLVGQNNQNFTYQSQSLKYKVVFIITLKIIPMLHKEQVQHVRAN